MCKWIHWPPSVCFTHFLNVAFCLIFTWLQHTGSEDLSLFMLVSRIWPAAAIRYAWMKKGIFPPPMLIRSRRRNFSHPTTFIRWKEFFIVSHFSVEVKNSDPEIPVTTFPMFRLFCQDFLTFRRQKKFQLGALTCLTKQFGLGTILAIVKCSCCFSLFTCV